MTQDSQTITAADGLSRSRRLLAAEGIRKFLEERRLKFPIPRAAINQGQGND